MYKKYTNKRGVPKGFVRQILLIMRLTTIILIMAIMQVSASTFAQRITLSEKNATIRKVFDRISDQSGFNFIFTSDLLKGTNPVTISVKHKELDKVLEQIFKDQPLSFSIEDKTVVVKVKKKNFLETMLNNFLAIDVTGRVVDANGSVIAGATINVKNTSISVKSGEHGNFQLNNVDENAVIMFSFIGFKTRELKAKEKMGDIVMEPAVSPLDEVHVLGYVAETRRLSVGTSTTVSSEEIENQPVINPLAALQGLVAGLNITPSSGAPNAAVRVQIRGQNSLAQSPFGGKPVDQPLFIVDGVPVAAQNFNLNALASFGGSDETIGDIGGSSPFNGLNPADIESVSVLKDVSATAIYGTQGANGVILITTKKGRVGKTKVRASVESAYNTPTRKIELLNLEQYLNYRREALENDEVDLASASPTLYPDLLLFDQEKSTDWFDYYQGGTSNTTNAHVSFSGGAERTTFFVSTGYTNAQYNFPGNFADKRFTLHSSLNYASADNRFTASLGADYSYQRNNTAASPGLTSGIFTPPNFPDLYDTAGRLNWDYKGYNTGPFEVYAANLKQPSVLKAYNMNNSLALGFSIVDDLKFSLNLGYSRILSDELEQKPASTINPIENLPSVSRFSNSIFETINIEPQLNYQRVIGHGVFSALLGGTYKKNNVARVQLTGTDYSDEALMTSIASAGTIQASDSNDPYRYVGAFARLGYIYKQRYIVQFSGRRDGSSNFGPGRQFGNFGSAGLGWIFSEEHFFERLTPLISYGKLSASYGSVGSDATAPYQYQQLFKPSSLSLPFQGTKPLFVQNHFQPDYGWDTKKSINVGLDLGFSNDRFLLNLNYYRDRIINQLVDYTLPSQTGFSSVLSNFDAVVENRGLEFSLTSKNIAGDKFSWSTTFTISGNRNQLISFPGLEESSYALIYSIGESVNAVKGYVLKGVNPLTGIFEFYKSDGTVTNDPVYGVPSQGGDTQLIANTDPKFIGGLGNTLSFKRFSLSFLFQFQQKTQANYLRSIYSGTMPGGLINQPVEVLKRWSEPGDVSPIQKLTANYGDAYYTGFYFTQSSGAYSDGSYIRLRTASLAYALPSDLCKKIGLANGNIFVNGQNLFLLTNYEVGDPELPNLSSFPLQRIVSLGLNITL